MQHALLVSFGPVRGALGTDPHDIVVVIDNGCDVLGRPVAHVTSMKVA